MTVWIQIIPTMDSDDSIKERVDGKPRVTLELAVGLEVRVFRTKQLGQAAIAAGGGLLLEIEAAQLRDVPSEMVEEGKPSVTLSRDGLSPRDGIDDVGPSEIYFSVDYHELPYAEDEEHGCVEFGPEALRWFEDLEKETGWELQQ